MRIVRPFLATALVISSAGCDLIQGLLDTEVPLEVPLETPAQEVDVSTKVDEAEAAACEDASSEDCLVLMAIDRTDDDAVSDPPSMPPEFPTEVDVDGDDATTEDVVNAEEWANEQGLAEAADLKVAVPVDLSDQVNVEDEDAIKSVTFDAVSLNFQENSLTFDTVPLDIYVSNGPTDSMDAQQLIDDGVVEKVGTLEAQPAGETGERPVNFVEGGTELFNTALKSLSFTLVAALPEGETPQLPKNDDGTMIIKPYGKAMLSLKAQVVFKVSASQLLDKAEEAQAGE
jgi:hypothetical protein